MSTDGKRSETTRCPSDTLTADQMQGFDVDVAGELAKRIGVEACFATPDWGTVMSGHWNNQWDINVGSLEVTRQLHQTLIFTSPYYFAPAAVAVTTDSGITAFDQLANQTLCAGSPSDYESWLKGLLDVPSDSIFVQPPANVKVYPAASGQECAQSLKDGKRDFVGYVDSPAAIQQNIAAGLPIVRLDGPVFSAGMAAVLDRSSSRDPAALLTSLNNIIKTLHSDGTLTALSQKWFQTDLTQATTN